MFSFAPAILAILLCGASLFIATRATTKRWLRVVAYIVFIAVALAMFQHLIPGFHNIHVFDKVRITSDAIPFTMYINFDKWFVGFFLYVFYIQRNEVRPYSTVDVRIIFRTAFILIAIFVPLATVVGFVRFEPKLPALAWAWALNNLFFVCFAEEAIFRGLIQTALRKMNPARMAGSSLGQWLPLAVSALLFGAAHYRGGLTYVCLATIAGLFYGYAYQKTGKIAVPIFVHFLLNAAHFFFFTYPALEG